MRFVVNQALFVYILVPPTYPASTPSTVDIIEFQSNILNLTAMANPANVEYTWYRNGVKLTFGNKNKRDLNIPHFLADGGVLNITNVTRADGGPYTCEAGTDQGKTNFTVNLNVQCEYCQSERV